MVETVVFNGVKYRRYPDSRHRSDRVYFTPGAADKQRGIRRLHEEIWIDAHGPIPEGHHIHHVDGDPLNNDLDNLECLTAKAHMGIHHGGQATPAKLANLERIRPLAAAWHSSPEGREWHSKHAYNSIRAIEPTEHTCEQCGAKFTTIPKKSNRFCSNGCKSAYRRAAGLDDIDRDCVMCGTTFRVNRYAKKKTCSKFCAARSQSLTKTSSPSARTQRAA